MINVRKCEYKVCNRLASVNLQPKPKSSLNEAVENLNRGFQGDMHQMETMDTKELTIVPVLSAQTPQLIYARPKQIGIDTTAAIV